MSVSAKTEKACKEWLEGLMVNNAMPLLGIKKDYEDKAYGKFGVSGRAFNRAWKIALGRTGNSNFSKPGRINKKLLG